jgi:hypothetical protein
MHDCNSSTQEAEVGGSLETGRLRPKTKNRTNKPNKK